MIIRAWPRGDGAGERGAAAARGHDVRPDVAERGELPAFRERGEASEPAARDVLEEHALDRLLGAEREDVVERRVDRDHHPIIPLATTG